MVVEFSSRKNGCATWGGRLRNAKSFFAKNACLLLVWYHRDGDCHRLLNTRGGRRPSWDFVNGSRRGDGGVLRK